MKAIELMLFLMHWVAAIGCVTAGLLLQEFGRADRGTELLRTGIGLGWFLVVLMIVLWRAQSKREDEEWERRERERYAREEELEEQERESRKQ